MMYNSLDCVQDICYPVYFIIEPYVLSFMSRQCRSYLAQLRNGILTLQLEVGRWINKAIEE